jgi:hypothetical protein
MLYLAESAQRGGTDPLGGRVRGNQFWIILFQGTQFLQQTVVFGIRDFRIVEDVWPNSPKQYSIASASGAA